MEVTIRTQKDVAQVAEALQRILDACGGEGVIIFACTKAITLTVAETLEAGGHQVAVLNGDVPQNQRERTVERLRSGSVDILVATELWPGAGCDRIGSASTTTCLSIARPMCIASAAPVGPDARGRRCCS